jgi:hypothetical protein
MPHPHPMFHRQRNSIELLLALRFASSAELYSLFRNLLCGLWELCVLCFECFPTETTENTEGAVKK